MSCTEIFSPVLKGKPERWLELVIIIDNAISMQIWQPLLKEFRRLLELQGTFTKINFYQLDTENDEARVLKNKRVIKNFEIINTHQPRLILVLSDCVAKAWHSNNGVFKLLQQWSKKHPVSIMQMLPYRLWKGTALGYAEEARFTAPLPLVLNKNLNIDAQDFWFVDDISELQKGFKIPILTLEPEIVKTWAKLVLGKKDNWLKGVVFENKTVLIPPLEQEPEKTVNEITAEQRIKQFKSFASPMAQQLAAYLATVPLDLSVMNVVQKLMLPQSQQVHLAEVLLGGLLKRVPNHQWLEYDFHTGVRELLLDTVTVVDALFVLMRVSNFVEQRFGQSLDFLALLENPNLMDGIKLNENTRPFAEVGNNILNRLRKNSLNLMKEPNNLSKTKTQYKILDDFKVTLHGITQSFVETGTNTLDWIRKNYIKPIEEIKSSPIDDRELMKKSAEAKTNYRYRTDDLRLCGIKEVIAPIQVHEEYPITDKTAETTAQARADIHKILTGQDDRLLVIVGPCSIYDPIAAYEYAGLLKNIKDELKNDLLIVMRVYLERHTKPIGWKGLINDPDINNSFNINKGLRIARKILLDINSIGIPTATEYLNLSTPSYISDLIAWSEIGTENIEVQWCYELASGASCPIGFKNSRDGRIEDVINATGNAMSPQHFVSLNYYTGRSSIFSTTGNEDIHIILCGTDYRPNYDAVSIDLVADNLKKASLKPNIMIDVSSNNSLNQYLRQKIVCEDVSGQISIGDYRIMGVMVKSNLKSGQQQILEGQPLIYGKSITDGCLDWEDTTQLLYTLSKAVRQRRNISSSS